MTLALGWIAVGGLIVTAVVLYRRARAAQDRAKVEDKISAMSDAEVVAEINGSNARK